MVAATLSHFRSRLRRDGNAVAGWFRGMGARRWFRWLAWLAAAGLLGLALIWVAFARDLPSVDQLRDYEPPLPTLVRDGEGKPVHSYARDRRVQLDYSEYPPLPVRAFLAAEDRTFFPPVGIHYPGIVIAAIPNLKNEGTPADAPHTTHP